MDPSSTISSGSSGALMTGGTLEFSRSENISTGNFDDALRAFCGAEPQPFIGEGKKQGTEENAVMGVFPGSSPSLQLMFSVVGHAKKEETEVFDEDKEEESSDVLQIEAPVTKPSESIFMAALLQKAVPTPALQVRETCPEGVSTKESVSEKALLESGSPMGCVEGLSSLGSEGCEKTSEPLVLDSDAPSKCCDKDKRFALVTPSELVVAVCDSTKISNEGKALDSQGLSGDSEKRSSETLVSVLEKGKSDFSKGFEQGGPELSKTDEGHGSGFLKDVENAEVLAVNGSGSQPVFPEKQRQSPGHGGNEKEEYTVLHQEVGVAKSYDGPSDPGSPEKIEVHPDAFREEPQGSGVLGNPVISEIRRTEGAEEGGIDRRHRASILSVGGSSGDGNREGVPQSGSVVFRGGMLMPESPSLLLRYEPVRNVELPLSLGVRGHAALPEGLARAVQFSATIEGHQARVIVEPPALGRVDVLLQTTSAGLEATLRVDNEALRGVVQGQLDQLRQTLVSQGLTVAQLSVDVRQQEQHQQQQSSRFPSGRRSGRNGGSSYDLESDESDLLPVMRLDLERGLLHWVA